jgi:hypothetical protein
MHQALAARFAEHVAPVLAGLSERQAGDLTTVAELKIAEWRLLTTALGIPVPRPVPSRQRHGLS